MSNPHQSQHSMFQLIMAIGGFLYFFFVYVWNDFQAVNPHYVFFSAYFIGFVFVLFFGRWKYISIFLSCALIPWVLAFTDLLDKLN